MKRFLTERQLLLLICTGGLILRLLGLINITLAGDFAYHWHIAGDIVTKGIFPLLGPSASVNTAFHLGPFYYYLLAFLYWFGSGNFHVAIIFFALFNTLSIYLLYVICKHWFSPAASLKIVALYAFSDYMISIQSFPWNPYLLPLGVILCLYCLIQIQAKRYVFVPLLFFLLSLCFQLHATAIFLLPVFLLLLLNARVPKKFYLTGILLFLVALSPWIYGDITTHFNQTKAAFAIFQPNEISHCSISVYLHNHGHGEHCFSYIRNSLFVFRIFSMSLFATSNIFVVVMTMIATLALLLKARLKQKKLLLVWLGIPWFCFLFYSSNVYLHYFLIFVPLPYILLGLLLEKIKKVCPRGNMASTVCFIAVLLLNLTVYLISLQHIRG